MPSGRLCGAHTVNTNNQNRRSFSEYRDLRLEACHEAPLPAKDQA